MPRDRTAGHEFGSLARPLRGDGPVPDADQGGAAGAPERGREAPRQARKRTIGADGPRAMGGSVQGNANRALILAEIVEKPGNLPQLEARTGLGKTTVWRWVNEMHDNNEVHITGWTRVREGGPFKATYSAGPGDNMPCSILPYSEAQKSRRFQKKKREEKAEFKAAAERARAAADRAAVTRDPMIAALFGPAPAKKTVPEPVVKAS